MLFYEAKKPIIQLRYLFFFFLLFFLLFIYYLLEFVCQGRTFTQLLLTHRIRFDKILLHFLSNSLLPEGQCPSLNSSILKQH